MSGKFKFAIDRGGTFTDIYARCPNGEVRVMKLLSVDPINYSDAPREGIRRILEWVKIIIIIITIVMVINKFKCLKMMYICF